MIQVHICSWVFLPPGALQNIWLQWGSMRMTCLNCKYNITRFSDGDTMRRWGHSNPTLNKRIFCKSNGSFISLKEIEAEHSYRMNVIFGIIVGFADTASYWIIKSSTRNVLKTTTGIVSSQLPVCARNVYFFLFNCQFSFTCALLLLIEFPFLNTQ